MKLCAGCTLCCTVFAIPEFAKSRWERCPHQLPDGCDCYATRPERCRIFSCLYQQNLLFFGKLPPKTAGFLAGYNVSTKSIDIHPDPTCPDKWQKHKKKLVRLGNQFPVVLVLRDRAEALGTVAQKFTFR